MEILSFLAFVLDEIDAQGKPCPGTELYLDQIWTPLEFRKNGYGTLVLNGLFAIALQEKRGIRATLAKPQDPEWFEKRGFHRAAIWNNFEILHKQIRLNYSIIDRIRSGEIVSIGIPFQ